MIGLGPFHTVSLKEARDRAKAARLQLQDGIDPLTAKREKRRAVVKAHTFKDAALQYIVDKGAGGAPSIGVSGSKRCGITPFRTSAICPLPRSTRNR